MIDHIGLNVRDVARATEFYLKALAPLGYGIVMQVSAEETGHGAAVGFGAGQKPSFWIGEGEPKSGPMHVAFVAPSRAAVMPSMMRRSRPAARTMARRVSGPNITPIITGPSSSIPTATMPRRSAICRSERQAQRAQFGSEKVQGSGGVTATFSPVLGSFFVS